MKTLSGTLSALLLLLFPMLGHSAETLSVADVMVHFDAMPSTELTTEAASKYNITQASNRAVLTVDAIKEGKHVPIQVYAGALNVHNYLINIPVREKIGEDGPRYVGEFYTLPSDNMTFIVNVNVLGHPLKAKFNRSFNH